MDGLRPRSITLESTFKVFSLDKGASDGSTLTMAFDVPPEMSPQELRKALLTEKERMDLLVLTMERAKGVVPDSVWVARKNRLKATYDQILKREPDVAASAVAE